MYWNWKLEAWLSRIPLIFFQNKNVFITNYIQARLRKQTTWQRQKFLELNIPRLTERQRLSCQGQNNFKQLCQGSGNLSAQQSPRKWRNSIRILQNIWLLISKPFIRCANECFEKSEMSSSQKQAVINNYSMSAHWIWDGK